MSVLGRNNQLLQIHIRKYMNEKRLFFYKSKQSIQEKFTNKKASIKKVVKKKITPIKMFDGGDINIDDVLAAPEVEE